MEKRAASLTLVDQATQLITGHRVGSVVGEQLDSPIVDYPGNPHGPLVARSTVRLGSEETWTGAEVLLVFEDGRSDVPIVVGLLQQLSHEAPVEAKQQKTEQVEALVDGQRVVIDARDEIVLRCGKASITLRRNGRVVIRGTYVETRSEGVNRIKGGSVQIN